MAKTPKTPARSPATASNQRKPITIEMVRLLAPTEAIYANIARTFALDPVPFDDIRAATEAAIIAATGPLEALVNEKVRGPEFSPPEADRNRHPRPIVTAT